MAAVTVSEVYDAVLTTTLRNMQPELRDNITRGNKLVSYLKMKGRMRMVGSGERIQVALMYGLNNAADVYDGYGITATTPQDGITSAFFPWSQLAVPITISGKEEMQNRGEAAKLGLLKSKTMQSEASGMQLLNHAIMSGRLSTGATGNRNQFVAISGALDGSANGPLPVPALVDSNASRSVAIGEINGNSESWWRNQVVAFSGSTYAAYLQQKGRLYNTCMRGILGAPDLIVSDQYVWELYFNSLERKERYTTLDMDMVNVLGGAAEDMLKYRNALHIWDEVVPDVGTSTATAARVEGDGSGVGTHLQSGAHGTEYHLNSKAMEYVVHSDRDWMTTPFVKPANQDARIAHLLWMGQLCISNRRKLGVMYDIDNSIAA